MLKIENVHDMDDYMEILSSSLSIYVDKKRLDEACDHVKYATGDLLWLSLLWLRIESAGMYSSMTPDNLSDYLRRIGIDLDGRYANKKTKGPSLDKHKVLKPLIENNVSPELLTMYSDFKTNKSYHSTLSKLKSMAFNVRNTISGRAIATFATHIEEQQNLRAYYSDIAVVSIPKDYSNIVTGPDDAHYIAWCDYPQADWRFAYNLFIRGDDSDSVMRECSDAYEGLARLVEGDKFNYESFKASRGEYKVHALSVLYGSKSAAPIPTAIRNYFYSRPKYRKILFDLDTLYRFKVPIPCTSYFGFEQLIPEGVYPGGFLSKALNTPIQTFTSHIVNETVCCLIEKFRSLGYTKDDINIYYVRHDEPLFLFTEAILKDAWVFEEFSDIRIPGFTPIKLDFHFGKYYREEDPELTENIRKSIQDNLFLVTQYSEDDLKNDVQHEYNPFPSVAKIYVQVFANKDGGLRVSLYDYWTDERIEFISRHSLPREAVVDALLSTGLEWLGNPKYLYARSEGVEFVDRIGPNDTFLNVVNSYDRNISFQYR